jgi:TRAP-type C4-dicarboxylate transport system permease large subunit
MAEHSDTSPPTEWERDQAREHVTQRLALVSSAIWAVGMIVFIVVIFPNGAFKPSSGMVVGAWLLALAAVPWAFYGRLVERAIRDRRRGGAAGQ